MLNYRTAPTRDRIFTTNRIRLKISRQLWQISSYILKKASTMPKILGVVTARGGSKSIPGKNIKLLGGKPLISHIIESAKKSGIFDRLILSTDDEKIAEVAKKYGVEMLFLRPAELAQDATPHLPVIEHALAFMRDNEKYTPEYTAILQPTSPMVKPQDFIKAFELLKEKNADSVIGVVKIPPHYNPLRSLKTDSDGFLSLFVTGDPVRKRISRRQDCFLIPLSRVFTETRLSHTLWMKNPALILMIQKIGRRPRKL